MYIGIYIVYKSLRQGSGKLRFFEFAVGPGWAGPAAHARVCFGVAVGR